MTYTMFVEVDAKKVESEVFNHLMTAEFVELTNAENENANMSMIGQQLLFKVIVCKHIYMALRGYKRLNVLPVEGYWNQQCGANVEFRTQADAMLFKLSKP